MADLTASIDRRYKGAQLPWEYDLVGYTNALTGTTAYTAYKGAIMCIEPTDVDGYIEPNTAALTPDGDFVFAGIALEEQAVAAADTADGKFSIAVARGGIWRFSSDATRTDIGAPAYAVTDNAVQTSSSNALWVGFIVDADGTWAWVDITQAVGRANSAT